MEKPFKPCDKEYMRMAMLKHEETFKEQVYELHRLYQIQKILMKNIDKSRSISGRNQERWSIKNEICFTRMKLDLEQPAAEEYIADSDGNGVVEIIDESEIELTLGPTSYNLIRRKSEAPLTSDSGPSFSSSSSGSSHVNRTTISSRTHQQIRDAKRLEASGSKVGLVRLPDTTSGCQSSSKSNIEVEEQLRQERLKQSPWLFQVLSLNMT
ncbi:hypothetical protein FNV43_RR19132 [Rhamnella rubrinervis]|uniref:Uncharacterized protein n=1 Tax=Rhamnella rubrinervis TaxID=2594499 RepID=A0A8K0GWN4_9ROSA|nr:hypothetical protein FNV43_RR19132 [Rhamnella rubrinervis]